MFVERWEKLQTGWLKINIDATVDVSENKTGFGWVVRDNKGMFVAAKCLSKLGCIYQKEVEAIAIR